MGCGLLPRVSQDQVTDPAQVEYRLGVLLPPQTCQLQSLCYLKKRKKRKRKENMEQPPARSSPIKNTVYSESGSVYCCNELRTPGKMVYWASHSSHSGHSGICITQLGCLNSSPHKQQVMTRLDLWVIHSLSIAHRNNRNKKVGSKVNSNLKIQ